MTDMTHTTDALSICNCSRLRFEFFDYACVINLIISLVSFNGVTVLMPYPDPYYDRYALNQKLTNNPQYFAI